MDNLMDNRGHHVQGNTLCECECLCVFHFQTEWQREQPTQPQGPCALSTYDISSNYATRCALRWYHSAAGRGPARDQLSDIYTDSGIYSSSITRLRLTQAAALTHTSMHARAQTRGRTHKHTRSSAGCAGYCAKKQNKKQTNKKWCSQLDTNTPQNLVQFDALQRTFHFTPMTLRLVVLTVNCTVMATKWTKKKIDLNVLRVIRTTQCPPKLKFAKVKVRRRFLPLWIKVQNCPLLVDFVM